MLGGISNDTLKKESPHGFNLQQPQSSFQDSISALLVHHCPGLPDQTNTYFQLCSRAKEHLTSLPVQDYKESCFARLLGRRQTS
jgi:hypothetical protein